MATDYFGAKYFSGGYFPESYFGTGEAADPNTMQGTIQGSSSCTATLSVAENQSAVTTSARFFGLPGPPTDRKKEQEEEPFPVVTIDQIAPQISALMEVHEVHSARRAAAQARESAARINRAIALRRTHDAALFKAAQKVALVQEIDRLIAEEVRRVEIEMDDEEVLLLAA